MNFRSRATGRYPISADEVRSMAPVLYGEVPPPEVLDAVGVDLVLETPPPLYDANTQSVSEGTPVQSGGSWRQTWTVSARPAPPVPSEVTMRQARIALSRADLLAKANKAIAEMPSRAGEEARIEWDYAATLRRDHPLVAGLGQSLGLTDAQIDALFVSAAGI